MRNEPPVAPGDAWITCPECHSPMPPGRERCERCQLKEDFEEGRQLTRSGDFQQALAMFKKVCTFEETPAEMRSEAYYCCGAIFLKQAQQAKAEAAWRKCLEINPGHAKARAKLAGLIAQRPKRKWSEQDRLIIEGSEFARAKPISSSASAIRLTRRTPLFVGSIAILLVLIAGYMAYNRINRYFIFDRHIEQIELLASTGQVAKSLQYFNDHFRSGDSAHRREQAERALAPIFRELGLRKAAEGGDPEEVEKILKIALDFNRGDTEILRALQQNRDR